MDLLTRYKALRERSEAICAPLETEDYVVQPLPDVSPPKWHLGHTSWFFETFLLKAFVVNYTVFDPNFDFVFNSYYETLGNRVIRTDRGNLSRPTVAQVYAYRKHVDRAMELLLQQQWPPEVENLILLGLSHEEQHQELLYTDIKYILGHNPLFPAYGAWNARETPAIADSEWITIPEGIYEIGFEGSGFSFDIEHHRHKVFLNECQIATTLVTNQDYLEFIAVGGYSNFTFWHAAGWDWVKSKAIKAPMYWHEVDGEWLVYDLNGLRPLDLAAPLKHISYYEAYAYASWKGMRLPTEFEWEAAASKLNWGMRWEWTESAFLPYPGFAKATGAVGEYNGKFMVGQKVLRGASQFTTPGHSRPTYRNFFPPEMQWQATGIRLAK